MKKINRKYRGFSLIELLVVIAIIGIMTSVVLVNNNKSKHRARVETATKHIASLFRQAQNNTLTGKQGNNGEKACGWGVYAKEYDPIDPLTVPDGSFEVRMFYNTPVDAAEDCDTFNSKQENRKFIPNPEATDTAKSVTFAHKILNGVSIYCGYQVNFYFSTPHAEIFVWNGSKLTGSTQLGILSGGYEGNIGLTEGGEVVEDTFVH